MEFHVYETGETVKAKVRPIVLITSNNEKELPDAFLRRCFFHYIRFPDTETMERIVASHYPAIKPRLVEEALRSFFSLRETPGLKKKPTTSELLDWLKLLLNEDVSPETLREREAKKLISAAARRALEERAGRASVREACFLEPAGAVRGGHWVDRCDDGGEFEQHPVAGGLDAPTAEGAHDRRRRLAPLAHGLGRSGLVLAHQARVAGRVHGEDGEEAAVMALCPA